ncbi:hypothetical protein ACM55H_01630 [Flavobacterium sp. ZT3R17]|uniref:FEKKY domain-containing protein n=1 Tax=Flavobacterium cryoconiti TaxID=3398736 RepID=UPI003A86A979
MKKSFLLILVIFISCKSRNLELSLEYKNQALHDIEVDSVKVFTFGLPFISPVESERIVQETRNDKISDIYKKYGLYRLNLGCVIDTKEGKSRKNYHKITQAYLEKRNKKGWKVKLEKEIDDIIYN